jgi:hypothetical protein
VIFSDQDGDAELIQRRRALASALGASLEKTRLLPFAGRDYAHDYVPEAGARGVFVDRHELGNRIYVLHRPRVASVLVETHNALDDREALRWEQPETRKVFARALASALATAFGVRSERGSSRSRT